MPAVARAAIVAALDDAEAAAPSAADEFTTLRWANINVVINSAASTGGDRAGPSTRGPPVRLGSSAAEARHVLHRRRRVARRRSEPALGETRARAQPLQLELGNSTGTMNPGCAMVGKLTVADGGGCHAMPTAQCAVQDGAVDSVRERSSSNVGEDRDAPERSSCPTHAPHLTTTCSPATP